MSEYIKREAIKYEQWAVGPLNAPLMVVRKETIDTIPAADVVERKRGEWVKEPPYTSIGGEYKKALICSECKSFFVSDGNKPWQMHNFCPNCGADMRPHHDSLCDQTEEGEHGRNDFLQKDWPEH